MKRASMVIALIAVGALAMCGGSQAASVSVNVVSEAGVLVYGPSASEFDGVPSGTASPSIELSPVNTTWPQAPDPPTITGNPELTGAKWITTSTSLPDPTATSYRLFVDSFTPPCTASHLDGTLHTAANNSQDVYFNDDLIGTGTDSGSGPPVLNTFTFTPIQGENTFAFDVLTNGVPSGQTTPNPAGVIYNAVITYDLPDVVWRPPIVNTRRAIVKNGTTLPIKFRLQDASGIMHTAQNIYLSISGPDGEVAHFALGHGGDSLRFAQGNGQYHANFHTKRFDLQTGVQYTVSVKDGCTGDSLGSLTIQVFGKGSHKNGNGNGNGHGNGNGNGNGHGKK